MCVKKLIGVLILIWRIIIPPSLVFSNKSEIRYCHIKNCANVTFQNNNNFPNTLLPTPCARICPLLISWHVFVISWTVTRFNYGRLPTTCRGLVRPIPIYRWNLWNKESFFVFLFLTAFILSPRPWQIVTVPQSGWPVLVACAPSMSYSLLPWRIWTVEQSFRNQVCKLKFSTSSAVLCLHRIFFLCVGVHWTFVWVNPFSVIW